MQLGMLDKLVVCLGLNHETAVAIDLFSHDALALQPLTLVPNKMDARQLDALQRC